MCNIITAYKSLNGSLYEKEEDCRKANNLYKESRKQDQAEKVLASIYTKTTSKYPVGDVIWLFQMLGRNWKELRDALNQIKE